MPYDLFNLDAQDLETHAQFWQLKIKSSMIIHQMYEFLGGDQHPLFSVPATFILMELGFKTIPIFLFSKYALEKEPKLYLALFRIILQIAASIPVALHKESIKNKEQIASTTGQVSVEGLFNWSPQDLETHAKYWQMKMKTYASIGAMYTFFGGNQCPTFSVPATFVFADLVFKALPTFLFNKYALHEHPNLYLILFSVIMQLVASAPVTVYKNSIKNMKQSREGGPEEHLSDSTHTV